MGSGVHGENTQHVPKHVEPVKDQELEHAPILLRQIAEVIVSDLLQKPQTAIRIVALVIIMINFI